MHQGSVFDRRTPETVTALAQPPDSLVRTEGVRSSSLLPPKAFQDRHIFGTTPGLLVKGGPFFVLSAEAT